MLLDLAGGWGTTLSNNAIYLGVDAQLGNIKIGLDNPNRYARSETTFVYRPVLQVRLGVPFNNVLPYIAGGVGYIKTISYGLGSQATNSDELPNGISVSARLGVDIKIEDRWFFSGYFQFEHCPIKNDTTEGQKRYLDSNEVVTGLGVGYLF